MNSGAGRPYRQTARAATRQATHDRILDAAIELFWAEPGSDLTLDRVAAHASVSVQTVIRHFGGREGLMAAAGERESARVAAERDPAAAGGDRHKAIADLVAHYERIGEGVLRMLAQETRSPALAAIAAQGRAFHQGWVAAVFGPGMERLDGETRRRRGAVLAAATDVQVWKLLRRDGGLTADEAVLALQELTDRLLEDD